MDLAGASAASAGTKARSALRSSSSREEKDGGERDTEYSLRYCVADYGTVAVVLPACRAVVEEYVYSAGDFQAPFDYLECAGRVMDGTRRGTASWQRVSSDEGGALWKDAVDVANLAQALVDFPDHDY